MIIFLLTLFTISIILLIPTIMLQSSGANNGMMNSSAIAGAFGAKSNEILVKFTSYCVALFILTALLLSIYFIRTSVNYTEAPAAPQQSTEMQGDMPADLPADTDLPLSE